MDKFEKQRRIFTINAVLLLVSVLSMLVILPKLFQESSDNVLPKAAFIASLVVMGVHLLIFIGFLAGIRLTRRKRRINKEINLVPAFLLLILGFMAMDGATAYMDKYIFLAVCLFLCSFCDNAALVVSVLALFILRTKKLGQPG